MRVSASQVSVARILFSAAQREEYYDHVADTLTDTAGSKNFLALFSDDVDRYGLLSSRGILSAHWHARFNETGGDLAATFRGTIPDVDVSVLEVAQRAGAGAVERSFAELARVTRLTKQAYDSLAITGVIAIASLGVAAGLGYMVLGNLAPNLRRGYRIPLESLGNVARRLFVLSDWVLNNAWSLGFGLCLVVLGVTLSVKFLTGRVRDVLDNWSIWRLFRDIAGIRFMLNLAIIVQQRDNSGMQLRPALVIMRDTANPWLRYHLDKMMEKIDQGIIGAETFNTGVLEKRIFYTLKDKSDHSTLDAGLEHTAAKVEGKTLKRLEKRAAFMRLVLMASGVIIGAGLLGWYTMASFEMINTMRVQFSAH